MSSDNGADALVRKLPSPVYVAVIECTPLDSAEVVKVYDPTPLVTVIEPRVVLPSVNVIVPVGTPAVATVNIAVNVTALPASDGVRLVVSVAVVGALLTVCVRPPSLV